MVDTERHMVCFFGGPEHLNCSVVPPGCDLIQVPVKSVKRTIFSILPMAETMSYSSVIYRREIVQQMVGRETFVWHCFMVDRGHPDRAAALADVMAFGPCLFVSRTDGTVGYRPISVAAFLFSEGKYSATCRHRINSKLENENMRFSQAMDNIFLRNVDARVKRKIDRWIKQMERMDRDSDHSA